MNIQTLSVEQMRVIVERSEPKLRTFLSRFYGSRRPLLVPTDVIPVESLPDQGRRLAPRVAPHIPGKPIASRGTSTRAFKPTYLKLNTPVEPGDVMAISGGDLFSVNAVGSDMQRHTAERARIINQHVERITDTWEYMAATAAIQGYVDTEYEGAPLERVYFGRDDALTVVKSAGSHWGDEGVSVIDDIQSWRKLMNDAENGGVATVAFVGSKVASFLVKQSREGGELHDLLDTRYVPDGTTMTRGLRGVEDVNYLGRLSGLIDVYEYLATFEDSDAEGNRIQRKPLGDNQIALFAQDFGGVMVFGKIKDLAAGYRAVPTFGRNFVEEGDPQREVVLHQSAPIMVPSMPNRTFLATVLSE